MTELANQEQAEYWASTSGQKWITYEVEIDSCLRNVNMELIRQSNPLPGERILDIGCGTGATSRDFANHLAPGGAITAIDISEPLLNHAKSNNSPPSVDIQHHLLDAQTADIPGAPFDLVISRFGVMFFNDPVAAFANIRRHLKPGGRMVLASWAALNVNPWFSIPAKAAIDHLGPVDVFDPNAPGPLAFQNIDHVENILHASGFGNVSGKAIDLTLHHPGPLETVTNLAANLGPATRIMQHHQSTDRDAKIIRTAIYQALEQFYDDTGVHIPARLNFYSAENNADHVN